MTPKKKLRSIAKQTKMMSDPFPKTSSSPRRRREDKHISFCKNELLVRRYHKRSWEIERSLKRMQKRSYFLLFGDAVDVIPSLAPPSAVVKCITKGIEYTPDLLLGDWVEVDEEEEGLADTASPPSSSWWDFLRRWRP